MSDAQDNIGGPGSFVVEARDYAVFGEALKRKLLLEFIARPDRDGPDQPIIVVQAGD